MATSRTNLKTYFETGDTPTEAQFAELIDAYRHVDEPVRIPYGAAIIFKANGNTNLEADEDGDRRERMQADGSLVEEVYDVTGGTWDIIGEIT